MESSDDSFTTAIVTQAKGGFNTCLFQVIQYLRKSVCGFSGRLPDVCCPEEKPVSRGGYPAALSLTPRCLGRPPSSRSRPRRPRRWTGSGPPGHPSASAAPSVATARSSRPGAESGNFWLKFNSKPAGHAATRRRRAEGRSVRGRRGRRRPAACASVVSGTSLN